MSEIQKQLREDAKASGEPPARGGRPMFTYEDAVIQIGQLQRAAARRSAVAEEALRRALAGISPLPPRMADEAHRAADRVLEGFSLIGYGEIANRLGAATRAAAEAVR